MTPRKLTAIVALGCLLASAGAASRNKRFDARRKKKALRKERKENRRYAGGKGGKSGKATPSPTPEPTTFSPTADYHSTPFPTAGTGDYTCTEVPRRNMTYPVCPGLDPADYCDGGGDCFNPNLPYCDCDAARAFCETGTNPCDDDVTDVPTMAPTHGGKAGKGAKSAKAGKATETPRPTTVPTNEPTPHVSIVPFYDGFEAADFAEAPWSVYNRQWNRRILEQGNVRNAIRRLDQEEDGGEGPYWALTTEAADGGLYSIRTPDLCDGSAGDDVMPTIAHVALETGPEWGSGGPGVLAFSVLFDPGDFDRGFEYVGWAVDDGDGDSGESVGTGGGWETFQVRLGLGSHVVEWAYVCFPQNEGGAAYIDNVYFIPDV